MMKGLFAHQKTNAAVMLLALLIGLFASSFLLTIQKVHAGPHYTIVYVSAADGDTEIYSMDYEFGNVTQLTTNTAGDTEPHISNDGGTIVFASDRDGDFDLYTMDIFGAGQTNITNDAHDYFNPKWSPDYSQIVAMSTQPGNDDIYIMDADGSNITQLTADMADDNWPEWSPDGSQIAFISERDGNPEVYVMDADGSNLTRLTNTAGQNEGQSGLTWTPDGNQIIYDRNDGVDYETWIMDSDGSNQALLDATQWYYPRFSSDGEIVIASIGGDVARLDATDSYSFIDSNVTVAGEDFPVMQPTPYISSVSDSEGTTTTIAASTGTVNMDYTVEANETLVVDGTLGNVTIESDGTLMGSGGILTATAESGATINVGNSPGCMTIGDLTLTSSVTYTVEIEGTTVCTEYDQTQISGDVDLGDADLDIQLDSAFEPEENDEFIIIENNGSNPITGTFSGLAEGDTIDVPIDSTTTYEFTISYVGGDGDDVVLTLTGFTTNVSVDIGDIDDSADSGGSGGTGGADDAPGTPDTGFPLLRVNVLLPALSTLSATGMIGYALRRLRA